VKNPKYCRDCEEATIHTTGSQLWVSCSRKKGWMSINAVCSFKETKSLNLNEDYTIKRTINDKKEAETQQRNAQILGSKAERMLSKKKEEAIVC